MINFVSRTTNHSVQPLRRWLGAVAVSLALAPFIASPTAVAADESPEFDQYCIACHGPDGRGEDNLGIDLVASAFVKKSSAEELVAFLKVGRFPDDPASLTGRPMPGFSWVSDSELAALASFLKARSGAP